MSSQQLSDTLAEIIDSNEHLYNRMMYVVHRQYFKGFKTAHVAQFGSIICDAKQIAKSDDSSVDLRRYKRSTMAANFQAELNAFAEMQKSTAELMEKVNIAVTFQDLYYFLSIQRTVHLDRLLLELRSCITLLEYMTQKRIATNTMDSEIFTNYDQLTRRLSAWLEWANKYKRNIEKA